MDEEIDELTRLPSRNALLGRLNDEIARAERYGAPLSLLLADVNDYRALGPERGASALQRLSLLLLSSVRESDMVARMGNDKFALLLPETGVSGAQVRAERLGAEVAAADVSDDATPLSVTLSIGVATFGPGLAESAALIAHAEEALRLAKAAANGGTAVRAFPEGNTAGATAQAPG